MSRRTRALNGNVPASERDGTWNRETASERKRRERAHDCLLVCPPKPHTGPCFAPARDKAGKIIMRADGPMMVQTSTCKLYPVAAWEEQVREVGRAKAGKPGTWEWHPGRGLSRQEIDNLLALSLPIATPEARKASLRHLFHKREPGRFHPDDFANAVRRIEEAGRV